MSYQDFIEEVAPTAQIICLENGLFPSVCIAQAALETGWGKARIGEFNLWGRKYGGWGRAIDTETQECYDGQNLVDTTALFQDYDSLEQAVEDYCRLFKEEPRYVEALQAGFSTPEEFIEAIGNIYATDPNYSVKIINIINSCDLKQYDSVA